MISKTFGLTNVGGTEPEGAHGERVVLADQQPRRVGGHVPEEPEQHQRRRTPHEAGRTH